MTDDYIEDHIQLCHEDARRHRETGDKFWRLSAEAATAFLEDYKTYNDLQRLQQAGLGEFA
mgnify:CR=1 FL=1